jgi:hypothetical protein
MSLIFLLLQIRQFNVSTSFKIIFPLPLSPYPYALSCRFVIPHYFMLHMLTHSIYMVLQLLLTHNNLSKYIIDLSFSQISEVLFCSIAYIQLRVFQFSFLHHCRRHRLHHHHLPYPMYPMFQSHHIFHMFN